MGRVLDRARRDYRFRSRGFGPLGSLPIEIPVGGGTISLDFGEGFIIEVTVTPN